MSINQRIREIRKALDLSQVKFAEGIAISNGYIAAIELGKRDVNERMIKLISFVYNVSERWLRTGEGEMFRNTADDKLERLTHCFKELQPEFQDYLLQQIDHLINLQEKTETR